MAFVVFIFLFCIFSIANVYFGIEWTDCIQGFKYIAKGVILEVARAQFLIVFFIVVYLKSYWMKKKNWDLKRKSTVKKDFETVSYFCDSLYSLYLSAFQSSNNSFHDMHWYCWRKYLNTDFGHSFFFLPLLLAHSHLFLSQYIWSRIL